MSEDLSKLPLYVLTTREKFLLDRSWLTPDEMQQLKAIREEKQFRRDHNCHP